MKWTKVSISIHNLINLYISFMMDELQNIEQAVLQLLVAFRSIDGTTLATHLESLRPDFPGQAEGLSLSDIFKRLNTVSSYVG